MDKNGLKIVDLFAGIGGLRQGAMNGLEKTNRCGEVVFTSEIKKAAREILETNWPEEELSGDITQIDEQDIPEHDLLLAGFPCQAFSAAGRRRGFEDTRGTLFYDVARILKHHKTEYFILENVPGLLHHDKGNTINIIMKTLKDLGYHTRYQVLSGLDFGIPQNRKRVFIWGSLHHPEVVQEIKKTVDKVPQLKDFLETGIAPHHESEKDKQFRELLENKVGIDNLRGKKMHDKLNSKAAIHSWDIGARGEVSQDAKDLMVSMITERRSKKWATLKSVSYFDDMPLSKEDIKTFYKGKENVDNVLGDLIAKGYLKYRTKNGISGYSIPTGQLSFSFFKILDEESYAPTLVATDLNGLSVVDGQHIRRFTETELKRLFGFPEDFKTHDNTTRNKLIDVFGNSVIVSVAEALTTQIFSSIDNKRGLET